MGLWRSWASALLLASSDLGPVAYCFTSLELSFFVSRMGIKIPPRLPPWVVVRIKWIFLKT